jgi:hypothetical protein
MTNGATRAAVPDEHARFLCQRANCTGVLLPSDGAAPVHLRSGWEHAGPLSALTVRAHWSAMLVIMCDGAVHAVLACVLMCCAVSCQSNGSSTSRVVSSSQLAAPTPTSSKPASSEGEAASTPVEQKTMASRLRSAPYLAPLPPGAPVAPGAKPTPEELELLAEAAAAPAWPPAGVKLGNVPTVKNFEEFWKPFRLALLAFDTDAMSRVTRFPFRVLSDSDPERVIERAEFPRLMRRLMAQDTGLQDDHESHLALVKRLHRIPPSLLQGPTARVGDLQFALFDPDGWRFESVWVNDIDESK